MIVMCWSCHTPPQLPTYGYAHTWISKGCNTLTYDTGIHTPAIAIESELESSTQGIHLIINSCGVSEFSSITLGDITLYWILDIDQIRDILFSPRLNGKFMIKYDLHLHFLASCRITLSCFLLFTLKQSSDWYGHHPKYQAVSRSPLKMRSGDIRMH